MDRDRGGWRRNSGSKERGTIEDNGGQGEKGDKWGQRGTSRDNVL